MKPPEKKPDAGGTANASQAPAPWESARPAEKAPPVQPSAPAKQKWHDPAFDKATKELPKGEVAKILAQAKAEMEAQAKADAAAANAAGAVNPSVKSTNPGPVVTSPPPPQPPVQARTTGSNPVVPPVSKGSNAAASNSGASSAATSNAASANGAATAGAATANASAATAQSSSTTASSAAATEAVKIAAQPPAVVRQGFLGWLLSLLFFWRKK